MWGFGYRYVRNEYDESWLVAHFGRIRHLPDTALNLVGMTGQSHVPAADKCSRVGAALPNLAKTVPLDWFCVINLKFTLKFFVLCGT